MTAVVFHPWGEGIGWSDATTVLRFDQVRRVEILDGRDGADSKVIAHLLPAGGVTAALWVTVYASPDSGAVLDAHADFVRAWALALGGDGSAWGAS